jgi:hypothetical protein
MRMCMALNQTAPEFFFLLMHKSEILQIVKFMGPKWSDELQLNLLHL